MMRPATTALLTMALAACGGATSVEPAPTGHRPDPSAAGPSSGDTGELVVRLGGPYPKLHFPLTVGFPGGSVEIPDGAEHHLKVPADDRELVRIDVEGWRPVWLRVPVGGRVQLWTHPCCGLQFDSNTYDDALAVCAVDDQACPAGHEAVPQALAADPVCPGQTRCVPEPMVRVVQQGAAGGVLIHEDDQRYPAGDAGAALVPADRNLADMFSFSVEGSSARHDVGMDAGYAYTIWLDGADVVRVTRDARLAPPPG